MRLISILLSSMLLSCAKHPSAEDLRTSKWHGSFDITSECEHGGYREIVVGNPSKFEIHKSGRKHVECTSVYATEAVAKNKKKNKISTVCCNAAGEAMKPRKKGKCKHIKDMAYQQAEAYCAAEGEARGEGAWTLCPASTIASGRAAGKLPAGTDPKTGKPLGCGGNAHHMPVEVPRNT